MRIMVVSDTHGQIDNVINEVKKIGDIQIIIHLGDYSGDAIKIREKAGLRVFNVKGNCDFYDKDTLEDKIIEVKGKRIFITHGHKYNVKYTLNNIYYKAKELNVDIAMFGHSHVPVYEVYNDIIIFNPGSITMPRGGSAKSYGILEINDDKVDLRLVEI